ncbi:MAG TPA: DUF4169 domain-containing protein [Alphaproteobacteria bacterium]|nr:DUF4169 domain-containing protein [Alphaproteobacteria bacterium]HAJ45369.1 DUF4169 domain-containing protein [Alphaproteobacteria bacterium]
MAEIVNLRRVRKAKSRAAKQDEAAANRIKFGQSKAVAQLETARRTQGERILDNAKIEQLSPLPRNTEDKSTDNA